MPLHGAPLNFRGSLSHVTVTVTNGNPIEVFTRYILIWILASSDIGVLPDITAPDIGDLRISQYPHSDIGVTDIGNSDITAAAALSGTTGTSGFLPTYDVVGQTYDVV